MYFHLSIRSTTNHWNSHLTKRQRRSTGTHTLPGQQNCCRTAEITLNWEKTNVEKLEVDYVDNTIGLLAIMSSLPYLISQKKSATPTSPCQGNRTLRLASSVTSRTCCDQFWTNQKDHILINVKSKWEPQIMCDCISETKPRATLSDGFCWKGCCKIR